MKLYAFPIHHRTLKDCLEIPDDDAMLKVTRPRLRWAYRHARRRGLTATDAREVIFEAGFAIHLLLHPDKVRFRSGFLREE